MIIDYISLENFRQFYGSDNKIIFSPDAPTIIYSTNGGGKSTVLNAFTWALYDSTSGSFKIKENIVNLRAIAEANVNEEITATVKIKFNHNDNYYILNKALTTVKTDSNNVDNKTPLTTMQTHSGDGNWAGVDDASAIINRIIPKDIHNYFFFDGERMEKMVSADKNKQKELKNAANKLSGIEIIDRSIKHLTYAANKFEQELKAAGNPELSSFLVEKNEAVEKIKLREDRNKEIDKEQIKCDTKIKVIELKLSENEATKKLQDRRDSIQKELDEQLTPALNSINKNLINHISIKGYTFFTEELLSKCDEQIEKMRKAGELPKGIKKQFVEDLLDNRQCICHSALTEGSKEREYVVEWKAKAGLEDVEERAMRVGGQIKGFKHESNNSADELLALKHKKRNLKIKISKLEEEQEEISDQLTNVSEEQLAALEANRTKFKGQKEEMMIEFNENTGIISEINKTIIKLDEKIQKIETGQMLTRLAQKRLNATNEAIKTLHKMLFSYQIDFRDRLQKTMQDNFSEITTLPYYPVIDDNFVISLKDDSTGQEHTVGASTGEDQVLSVTFILGLIQEIRQHNIIDKDDNLYPILMDSPFGQLGSQYRTGVAKFIPTIASQTILLVSETQWRVEVENALEQLNPKIYCLTYHNPAENAQDITSTIYNKEIALQLKSDEYEWTSITAGMEN